MAEENHYETLEVNSNASQEEIKQAYRRLVKQFHPDINQDVEDNDQIIRINAAYEVLGDAKSRQHYDRQQNNRSYSSNGERQARNNAAHVRHQTRQSGKDADELIEEWLHFVYQPVNKVLCQILKSWEKQLEKLSADPFDDELLEAFQEYLDNCKADLKQAQFSFRSLPNPPSLARAAAHLYYCLNQVSDALDELGYFPLNYDDSYLHVGQEMFRIAGQLYYEVEESMEAIA